MALSLARGFPCPKCKQNSFENFAFLPRASINRALFRFFFYFKRVNSPLKIRMFIMEHTRVTLFFYNFRMFLFDFNLVCVSNLDRSLKCFCTKFSKRTSIFFQLREGAKDFKRFFLAGLARYIVFLRDSGLSINPWICFFVI